MTMFLNNADIQTKVVPNGKTEAWAQFNKISGAFVGLLQKIDLDGLNHDFFDYVAVEIDLEKETIEGTKDNFTIISYADQPQPIYERALDNLAYAKIDKAYPIYHRLEILEEAVLSLCNAAKLPNEKLEELVDTISEIKRINNVVKEDIAADPEFNYISRTKEQEIFDAELEGGLHEFQGPREPSPAILDVTIL